MRLPPDACGGSHLQTLTCEISPPEPSPSAELHKEPRGWLRVRRQDPSPILISIFAGHQPHVGDLDQTAHSWGDGPSSASVQPRVLDLRDLRHEVWKSQAFSWSVVRTSPPVHGSWRTCCVLRLSGRCPPPILVQDASLVQRHISLWSFSWTWKSAWMQLSVWQPHTAQRGSRQRFAQQAHFFSPARQRC